MTSFFESLLVRHEMWRHLSVVERSGEGWNGVALIIPPPPEADLCEGLDIEEVGGEITISFDYSHIHLDWPVASRDHEGDFWRDPLAMIDAILDETVVAASGWIDGNLRVGSLRKADGELDMIVPKLQRVRVRSWRGTFDRDDVLA